METTTQQKKVILTIVIVVFVIALVLLVARRFNSYLATRIVPVPDTSDVMVGGLLKGESMSAGNHTLEFRARTSEGQLVNSRVTFTAGADPYTTTDPYTPTASPSPSTDPYSPR